MFPQSACPRGGIVTLVAFAWHFSTVSFQMCFQIAFPGRYIVALAAFVWLSLFSSGFFHLYPLNKSHNFQDFGPLPLRVVLWPIGCFKLIELVHWRLVSNNHKILFNSQWHTFTFSWLSGRCLCCKCSKIRAANVPKKVAAGVSQPGQILQLTSQSGLGNLPELPHEWLFWHYGINNVYCENYSGVWLS